MAIEFMPLPFDKNALSPFMSSETLDFHYGKHHKKYVDTLNKLIVGTEYEKSDLEDIIQGSYQNEEQKKIFNNAGQAWNHNFFWQCLTSPKEVKLMRETDELIKKSFGSFDEFKKKFSTTATDLFGSGWAWLVYQDNKLSIEGMSNAGTPIAEGRHPVLTCDVWEHAYYIDYRNERPKFIDAFWNLVNWDFVVMQINVAAGKPGRQFISTEARLNPPIQ